MQHQQPTCLLTRSQKFGIQLRLTNPFPSTRHRQYEGAKCRCKGEGYHHQIHTTPRSYTHTHGKYSPRQNNSENMENAIHMSARTPNAQRHSSNSKSTLPFHHRHQELNLKLMNRRITTFHAKPQVRFAIAMREVASSTV